MTFTMETPQILTTPVVPDPVIGAGLILNRTSTGNMVLHAVTPGHVRELGCFDSIVEAWKAVDEVDRAAA